MSSIILASQSPYRANLLHKIGLSFRAVKPTIDEDQLKSQLEPIAPLELAQALAEAKAKCIYESYPNDVVIGSDQLLECQSQILGKALNFENAKRQLAKMQGQTLQLITSMAIYAPTMKQPQVWSIIARMKLRPLSENEIARYLKLDEPYDCAGSFKIERAGITLFESIECSDWTAIEGLGLISLTQNLKSLGILNSD